MQSSILVLVSLVGLQPTYRDCGYWRSFYIKEIVMKGRKIEVDGFTYPSAMQAWRAEAVPGLNYTTFMERLYAGWEAWRALRVKPQHGGRSRETVEMD